MSVRYGGTCDERENRPDPLDTTAMQWEVRGRRAPFAMELTDSSKPAADGEVLGMLEVLTRKMQGHEANIEMMTKELSKLTGALARRDARSGRLRSASTRASSLASDTSRAHLRRRPRSAAVSNRSVRLRSDDGRSCSAQSQLSTEWVVATGRGGGTSLSAHERELALELDTAAGAASTKSAPRTSTIQRRRSRC